MPYEVDTDSAALESAREEIIDLRRERDQLRQALQHAIHRSHEPKEYCGGCLLIQTMEHAQDNSGVTDAKFNRTTHGSELYG